jgi:hypothetical protein
MPHIKASAWHVKLRGEKTKGLSRLELPAGMSVAIKEETELDNVNIELKLENEKNAKKSMAMSLAIAPGKALFQTAFMLWMSGSSIQIFSIYTLFNALSSPVKGLVSIESVFGRFSGVDITMAKLIYVGAQLASLFVALYKCHTMGLLPLSSVDWLWTLPDKAFEEVVGVPL